MAYADPPHPEEVAERPSRRTHRSPSGPQLGSVVMPPNQFALLRTRRFLPLFVTQFLGALNDNFFKNALVILVTYRLAAEAGLNGQILVTAAAGPHGQDGGDRLHGDRGGRVLFRPCRAADDRALPDGGPLDLLRADQIR